MLKEGTPSKSFFEVSITLISKPDKEITKKEANRPTSFVNIDTEVLSQTLSQQIKLVLV